MNQPLTPETAQMIIDQLAKNAQAKIFEGNTQHPFEVQVLTLNLTTARLETDPFRVNFPWRTVFVKKATDSSVEIQLKPQTDDSYQSSVPLNRNDIFSNEYPFASASLYWSAQPGKSITLIFFVNAEFRSGSLISVTSGGLVATNGDSFTTANLSFVAATPLKIFNQDFDRKNGVFQNNSGAVIYLGTSSVSSVISNANIGLAIQDGQSFEWKNTAELWGISALGGYGMKMEEK